MKKILLRIVVIGAAAVILCSCGSRTQMRTRNTDTENTYEDRERNDGSDISREERSNESDRSRDNEIDEEKDVVTDRTNDNEIREETCNNCDGEGYTVCSWCKGTGKQSAAGMEYTCPTCGGTGQEKCVACGGSGKIIHYPDSYSESLPDTQMPNSSQVYNNFGGSGSGSRICSYCGGRGQSTCSSCHGSGYLEQQGYAPSYGVREKVYDQYGNSSFKSNTYMTKTRCSRCSGSGMAPCIHCGGTGTL